MPAGDGHRAQARQRLLMANLVVVVGVVGLLGVGATLLWPASTGATRLAAPPPTVAPAPAPTTTSLPPPQVPVSTVLAAPKGSIPTYSSPGVATGAALGTWYGFSLVVPVIDQRPGWLLVRLPQRPNGSTAWVRAEDVSLSSTPYRLVVSLSQQHLVVYQGGYPVMDFPAGLGTPATPTAAGHFFVAVHESKPDPFYGPVVLDTSAHSEAIRSWEGSGDAIIAIHGPINSYADARIGTTGARISNGCIRLHNTDLAKLAVIPAGTPIDIVA